MDGHKNRKNLLITINELYNSGTWEEGLNLANVASIFKNGDSTNLEKL